MRHFQIFDEESTNINTLTFGTKISNHFFHLFDFFLREARGFLAGTSFLVDFFLSV
tara:strand:+ start:138 stop:305 length:168 start_codon:yes stop_codon:yes gene_type:complete